ncbi:MAG: endonuclease/exonuclease/phosphatase family protein [Alphaproteobacteria bacterium]
MSYGTKRLIYKISLADNIVLFFAHFSLSLKTRKKQFEEIGALIRQENGDVIIMADFNVMKGFGELADLLEKNNLHILNEETAHTFTFYRKKIALDLCICSKNLFKRSYLKIIPQPFSDHAGLLLEIR